MWSFWKEWWRWICLPSIVPSLVMALVMASVFKKYYQKKKCLTSILCHANFKKKWRSEKKFEHIVDNREVQEARSTTRLGEQWHNSQEGVTVKTCSGSLKSSTVNCYARHSSLFLVEGRRSITPNDLAKIITSACDVSMPRRVIPKHRKWPVYWWNDEIAELGPSATRQDDTFNVPERRYTGISGRNFRLPSKRARRPSLRNYEKVWATIPGAMKTESSWQSWKAWRG